MREIFLFSEFSFLKCLFINLVDLLEEKVYSKDLAICLIGYYIYNLSSSLYGTFEGFAICEPLFASYLSVPSIWLIEKSVFSSYSHHLYGLVFLGNLKRSPFFIRVLSMTYCIYDFILVFTDVIHK